MNIQQMISRFSFCFLAWCTLAVAPTLAQTITHVPITFEGDSRFSSFGDTVSGAGDINGDGYDDVIVGGSDGPEGSGGPQVISGVDSTVLYNFRVDTDSTGPRLGTRVSGAGDVNGDGVPDLIIRAGFPIGDDGSLRIGGARVMSGSDGTVLLDLPGNAESLGFGHTLSGAGDVNGDGFDDLIVGAWADDSPYERARVFSGVDGSVLYNFQGDEPEIGLDDFGFSVSGAGDVNGDGFADLIVGARADDNNGSGSGSARVYSGVDGSTLYTFDGDSRGASLGFSVSDAGDVNGDGVPDLIVGAPGDSNIGLLSGSARVYSGVDGSVLYTLFGDPLRRNFGRSVSGAGDVNGDGFADLIVGAGSDGAGRSGSAWVFSGVDGSFLYKFDGDSTSGNDRFGSTVSGAGDVNGDGVDDFIVGARLGGDNFEGYARLFVSQITVPFILGDVDQDGEVTFADIALFIGILQAGDFLDEADCNQDGEVTFADIAPFIAILQAG